MSETKWPCRVHLPFNKDIAYDTVVFVVQKDLKPEVENNKILLGRPEAQRFLDFLRSAYSLYEHQGLRRLSIVTCNSNFGFVLDDNLDLQTVVTSSIGLEVEGSERALVIVWSAARDSRDKIAETCFCRDLEHLLSVDTALFNCRCSKAFALCNMGKISHVVSPGRERYHLHSILERGTTGIRGGESSIDSFIIGLTRESCGGRT